MKIAAAAAEQIHRDRTSFWTHAHRAIVCSASASAHVVTAAPAETIVAGHPWSYRPGTRHLHRDAWSLPRDLAVLSQAREHSAAVVDVHPQRAMPTGTAFRWTAGNNPSSILSTHPQVCRRRRRSD